MPETDVQPGSNGPPYDEDQFLAFLQRSEDCESEEGAALEAGKAPKKRLKDAKDATKALRTEIAQYVGIDAFDRARADYYKPASQREAEFLAYRKMMAWQRKPLGTQAGMFEDIEIAPAGTAALHRIDGEGHEAGRNGHGKETNTYTPGTAEFARFETAHDRGWGEFMTEQSERAAALSDEKQDAAAAPKRRGRPPGPAKTAAAKPEKVARGARTRTKRTNGAAHSDRL